MTKVVYCYMPNFMITSFDIFEIRWKSIKNSTFFDIFVDFYVHNFKMKKLLSGFVLFSSDIHYNAFLFYFKHRLTF